MQNDIYAAVDQGRVIEFPVTVDIILARGHTVHQYFPVVFDQVPSYSAATSRLENIFVIEPNRVRLKYEVRPFTLPQVLSSLKSTDGSMPRFSDLDPALVGYIQSMVSNYVEGKVSRLAAERGYLSLNNVLGRYTASTNAKYRKEAMYIQSTLDSCWDKLEAYFEKLKGEALPMPSSVADIDRVIGELTWDNFQADEA